MKNYTLHHISLFSLFKFGLVVGLVLNLIPSVLFTLAGLEIFKILAVVFQNMKLQVGLPLSGNLNLEMDLLRLLKLENYALVVNGIAAATFFEIFFFILALALITSVYNGLAVALGGAVFNLLVRLSGGLELTLSTNDLTPLAAVQGDPAPSNVPQGAMNAAPRPANQTGLPATAARLEISQPFMQSIPLASPVSIIGSGSNCHIRLNGLLPAHFQISQEREQTILKDLTQGQSAIQVQGHRVQGVNLLKDGFVIQASPYTITFRQG